MHSRISFFFALSLLLPNISWGADNGLAQAPLRGWSSWSSLHSQGGYNEEIIKAEADSEAARLKSSGYIYINMDDGWQTGFDEYGRPVANPKKFPNGLKPLADYIHSKGLKFGIYLMPGLNKDVWKKNSLIFGTSFTAQQIADPTVLGNTKATGYHIDFSKPGAVEYIQSCADLFASWGVDYIKMDFVAPGGGKVKKGVDTREDIKQWMTALKKTGRPIWLELSNSLSFENAAFWKQYSNGWRIESDIEDYGKDKPLTSWWNVYRRFVDAPKWAPFAGPGGWNDLDSVEIGNGDKDGLTPDERRTVMSLWCISCSPIILGSDLRNLDPDDVAIITNPELLAVQAAGRVATPISQATAAQVWRVKNADGSYTVALFAVEKPTDHTTKSEDITVKWSDLGLQGPAYVHDLWSHKDLGKLADKYEATVPAHGVVLLRVSSTPP